MTFTSMRRTLIPAGVVALMAAVWIGAGAAQAATVSATIQGFAFSPNPVVAAPGDTITYSNKDARPHTVTSDTAGTFDSGNIAAGASGAITAPTKLGYYTYFCKVHPNMKGGLLVTNVKIASPIGIPQIRLETNSANALGFFSGSVNSGSVSIDLSGDGDTFVVSHFHRAAAGANGPVVALLWQGPDGGQDSFHITGSIGPANLVGPLAGDWDGFIEALRKGEIYVNVHSTENPGGVLRGQVSVPSIPSVPSAPATGSGLATDSGSGLTPTGLGVVLLSIAGIVAVVAGMRRSRA